MKQTIKIPYGDSERSFEANSRNLLYTITSNIASHPTIGEEIETVRRALENPVGSRRIKDFVNAGDSVALLVDDVTRPTPIFKVAPTVLEELNRAGVKDQNITLIVARGTHRRLTYKEFEEKIGKDVVSKVHIENHENDKDLVKLGVSRKGTPVWINKKVARADRKIAIGNICTHPVAGYGGGAKIIMPGVSGKETINKNHSLSDDPNVTIGVTDGNPVREDMEDIARMVGLDFIVNVILNREKEIVHAVAGDVVQAHREGVKTYKVLYGTEVKKQADIAVVGSSPRDITFGHATFALYAAVPMVKEKGTIILVAPCTEGLGYKDEARRIFKEQIKIEPAQLMASMKEGKIDASDGVFIYCYSNVLRRNKVFLVSDGISSEEAHDVGVEYSSSLQKAVDKAFEVKGENAKITVLPLGGLTVPQISQN